MRTQTPLDVETWNRVLAVMTEANQAGRDKIEALHQAGLITTIGERRAIRARAVKYVHDLIQAWTPLDFLARRTPRGSTAIDMYDEIVEFVREVHEKVQVEDEFRL
jgi:hypothetical protein